MLIHSGVTTRRTELTDQLGITRTATGGVLRELAELTLVQVSDGVSAGGGIGRPSPGLAVHPDAPAGIAVHIRVDGLHIARVAIGGRIDAVAEVPLPAPADPRDVLDIVAEQIISFERSATIRTVGVGVAVPSAIGAHGVALSALPLRWPTAVPIGRMVAQRLAAGGCTLPVSVGNDANLAALAESRHGAGRGARQLLFLMCWPRGVGGGLVIDGQVHTGSAGYALEVGHITVEPGGNRCHCGNTGCLEVHATPGALVDMLGGSTVSASELPAAARRIIMESAADPRARRAVDAVIGHLAIGLGTLINILNPDRIVLDALPAELLAAYPDTFRGAVARRSYLDQASEVDIVPARLARAGLLGAAEFALQPVLDDPRVLDRR